jgi:predicted ATPase
VAVQRRNKNETSKKPFPDGRITNDENEEFCIVALTREFKKTVQARVRRDPAFRRELLRESAECFLSGDVETGKTILRDYINATVGFNELSAATHHPAKSLMRMLCPSGNPQARNLFEVVEYLQRKEKVRFKVAMAIR